MKFIKRLIILSGEKNKGTLAFEKNAYGVFVKLNTYGAPIKDAYLSMVIDGKRFGNPSTEAQFSLNGIDTVQNVHAAIFAADKLVMYGTNESKRMSASEIMRLKPAQKKPSQAALAAAKPRDVEKGEIFSGRKDSKRPQDEKLKTEYIQADNGKTEYAKTDSSKTEYLDDAIAESNYYPPIKEDINVREKTRLKLFGESADDLSQDLDEPFDDNARAEILRRVAAAQAGASPVIESLDSEEVITAQIGDMLKGFGVEPNVAPPPAQDKEPLIDVKAGNIMQTELQKNIAVTENSAEEYQAIKAVQENSAINAMQENAARWDEYLKQNKDKAINSNVINTDNIASDGVTPHDLGDKKNERAYPCAIEYAYIMNQSNSAKLSPFIGDNLDGTDTADETISRMEQNLKEVKKMIPDEKQNAVKNTDEKASEADENGIKEDRPKKAALQKPAEDSAQEKKGGSIKNKKTEKVASINGDRRVKARGGTFYERNGEEIERLFSGEREKDLEDLLPNSKWVKIDYNGTGKYYVIGLIGKEYLCYGVPAVYTPVPPKELNGYCWWFPIKPQEPQGKGYWIMYQNLTTGEAVFPPKE